MEKAGRRIDESWRHMKNGVKQMQGVSAYIETHYEAWDIADRKRKYAIIML